MEFSGLVASPGHEDRLTLLAFPQLLTELREVVLDAICGGEVGVGPLLGGPSGEWREFHGGVSSLVATEKTG